MTIGFMGAGRMAEAILTTTLQTGVCEPWEVVACDKDATRRERMAREHEVAVTDDLLQVVKECKVLFLAVKPQDVDALLAQIKDKLTKQHLLISIAAGRRLTSLRKGAGEKPRLMRVMPNLPLMVQEGMSAYCAAEGAKPADKRLVTTIFGTAGAVLELPEKQFDAVTALSGSGPAFVAAFLQALIKAATALKLPADAARLLAEQTVIGTGIYLQNSNSEVGEFIKAVCSPGGTTEAGMRVLQAADLDKIVAATLRAAAERSKELSK